jgi:hypothetical protein
MKAAVARTPDDERSARRVGEGRQGLEDRLERGEVPLELQRLPFRLGQQVPESRLGIGALAVVPAEK